MFQSRVTVVNRGNRVLVKERHETVTSEAKQMGKEIGLMAKEKVNWTDVLAMYLDTRNKVRALVAPHQLGCSVVPEAFRKVERMAIQTCGQNVSVQRKNGETVVSCQRRRRFMDEIIREIYIDYTD